MAEWPTYQVSGLIIFSHFLVTCIDFTEHISFYQYEISFVFQRDTGYLDIYANKRQFTCTSHTAHWYQMSRQIDNTVIWMNCILIKSHVKNDQWTLDCKEITTYCVRGKTTKLCYKITHQMLKKITIKLKIWSGWNHRSMSSQQPLQRHFLI
jgi:hypothetical protein